MTRWTEAEYGAYRAKQDRIDPLAGKREDADEGPESKLQGKITKLCKDKAWPCLSFRQSSKARGFIIPGWPDLTVVQPDLGRVIFMELKTKTGRRTPEQKILALQFSLAGSPIHLVRSFKQALKILGEVKE